jgi:hypothetical protein
VDTKLDFRKKQIYSADRIRNHKRTFLEVCQSKMEKLEYLNNIKGYDCEESYDQRQNGKVQ